MAKNSSKSLVNLASVIAVFIAIAVFAIQLLEKYIGLGISTDIIGLLTKIKDVCLVLVVAVCACNYASSMRDGAMRTLIYVFAAIFVVLAIVGIVLI